MTPEELRLCLCPELRTAGWLGECPACKAWRQTGSRQYVTSDETPGDETPGPTKKSERYLRLAPHRRAIAAAISAGVPYDHLAREYQVTSWAFRRFLDAAKLYRPRTRPKARRIDRLTPKILTAQKAGKTFKAIAIEFGVSTHTVRRICHGERQATKEMSHD